MASTFHERLELARGRVGISARQCDRLAGKAYGTCALLEKHPRDAKGSPRGVMQRTAEAYAEGLGVPLPWLMLGLGDEPCWAEVRRRVEERLGVLRADEHDAPDGPTVDRSEDFNQAAGAP
jgi:hypothetical protein